MQKIYTLTLTLCILTSFTYAQSMKQQILNVELIKISNNKQPLSNSSRAIKTSLQVLKKHGDTLYYEDFDGGLNGWTAVNNNVFNNNSWEWNTMYRTGQFTNNITAIKSTTASNGFMSLPADHYNTPMPAGGSVEMNTYFESPTITLPPANSIYVTYQQYLRYCCSGSNKLVLQVSTDNFMTWEEFDASNNLEVNEFNTSNSIAGAINGINISCALQGDTTFKIRFYAKGNTHYFWMIDDIAVIEGVHNDLELQNSYMEFNGSNYTYNPFYGQVPNRIFPPLSFSGEVKNNGDYTSTNTIMNISVDHLASSNGGSGNGNLHAASQLTPNSGVLNGAYTKACDSTTLVLTSANPFIPFVTGDFQVNWLVSSDSVDQNLGNETATQFFSITDTVYARDNNNFDGVTGPSSFFNTTANVGDRFATLYIIEKNPGVSKSQTRPTSITYLVSGNPANIGIQITPKIWLVEQDSLFVNGNFSLNRSMGPEVAGSSVSYTVTAADTGSSLTLPLNMGSVVANGFDSSAYAVGWEVTNAGNGQHFEVLDESFSAATQKPLTNFIFYGNAPASGWGWVRANPGIRLNMGNLSTVGIDKTVSDDARFSIIPNPSNGEFKINISTTSNTTFDLNVRNMLGQSVYTEVVKVNNQMTKQLDLKSFEKGIYFVSLESENEKLVEKVIFH